MNSTKRITLLINVLGGCAVLFSYAHGLSSNPMTRGDVWGGVPDALRPLYTINMFLAAAGYFAFSYFVFFRLDPEHTRIGKRFGFGAFNVLYALILIPSALWLPLTFAMLETTSTALWWGDPPHSWPGGRRLPRPVRCSNQGPVASRGRRSLGSRDRMCVLLPPNGGPRCTGLAGILPSLTSPIATTRGSVHASIQSSIRHPAFRLEWRAKPSRRLLARARDRSRLHPTLRLTVLS